METGQPPEPTNIKTTWVGRLRIGVILLVLMVMIAACGGETSSTTQAPGGSTDSTTSSDASTSPSGGDWTEAPIRVIIAEGGLSRALTEAARDFEEETGGTVEIVTLPYDEARERQLLELAGGTGALDAVLIDGRIWLNEMVQYLDPLDASFVDGDLSRFVESMPAMFQADGETYALPTRVGGWVLIYRQDIFDEAGIETPETWTEFRQVAEELTGDGTYGFAAPLAQNNFLVIEWLVFVRSWGEELLTEDNSCATFNTPGGVEATEFLVNLYKDGLTPPGAIDSDHDSVITAMQQGTAAMTITYSPYVLEMNDPEQSEFAGQFNVSARVPYQEGTGLETGETVLAGWGVGVPTDSQNKEGAWRLAEYLTRDDVQKTLAVEYGNSPTTNSVYSDPDYLEIYPAAEAVLGALQSAATRPGLAEWSRVEEALALRLSEAMTGASTGAEAIANAEADVNEILGCN